MSNAKKGFSLLEALISLFFFLLIIFFSLDCFVTVRSHFAILKEAEISNTAVYAALDRMRKDLYDAGLGLSEAIESQVLEGITDEFGMLVILSKGDDLAIEGALITGQLRIPTPDAPNVKKGQQIVIFNPFAGEVHSVITTDQDNIVLDFPLLSDYSQENTKMILLRKISLFLDETYGVLRRKVNASPAQPLLEDVARFAFEYSPEANLVRLDLSLKSHEEKKYETTVFPKNTAISSILVEK